jgi:hypothetical protein
LKEDINNATDVGERPVLQKNNASGIAGSVVDI